MTSVGLLEGVVEGQDNSGNTGQADGEDYPLLEQGESLAVSPISTSMITHGGRGRISNSSYLRGTPFERRNSLERQHNFNRKNLLKQCTTSDGSGRSNIDCQDRRHP